VRYEQEDEGTQANIVGRRRDPTCLDHEGTPVLLGVVDMYRVVSADRVQSDRYRLTFGQLGRQTLMGLVQVSDQLAFAIVPHLGPTRHGVDRDQLPQDGTGPPVGRYRAHSVGRHVERDEAQGVLGVVDACQRLGFDPADPRPDRALTLESDRERRLQGRGAFRVLDGPSGPTGDGSSISPRAEPRVEGSITSMPRSAASERATGPGSSSYTIVRWIASGGNSPSTSVGERALATITTARPSRARTAVVASPRASIR